MSRIVTAFARAKSPSAVKRIKFVDSGKENVNGRCIVADNCETDLGVLWNDQRRFTDTGRNKEALSPPGREMLDVNSWGTRLRFEGISQWLSFCVTGITSHATLSASHGDRRGGRAVVPPDPQVGSLPWSLLWSRQDSPQPMERN